MNSSWKNALKAEFSKPYFQQIVEHIKLEKASGVTIFPPGPQIFNAFELTPYEEVKVVIIGQDPYHGAGQAHGLSFSVQDGVKPPPSLVNIFKELRNDIGMNIPTHGNLSSWAKQGVLLLNASLTVRANEPMSHSKIGWATFTDAVIKKIASEKEKLVFLLWGKFAQEKASLINLDRGHLILQAPHPSPFSADKGFFGCKHFSQTNQFLLLNGKDPIDWSI